ncbi:type I-E CRISPR-associated protein Cse2/CasB [Streptomyces caniferus]|uniref:type I-E CRISPR-associated protein Cse2/CasB n=1 Tax=Streptomyces caniferus TaxID=285557 RepID=UPI00380B253B
MSATPETGPSGTTEPTASTPVRRYWSQCVRNDGTWRIDPKNGALAKAPGEDLAALRSGLGQPAGTVPALWPFYTSHTDGQVTPELEAEHAALSLYGLHQQSQAHPMHKRGVGLGAALRDLRHDDRFSTEAVDRRVAAAVNTTSVPTLVYRLRGLITQLRSVKVPLDYDQLLQDIKNWHYPESRRRVRRTWGLAYHSWNARPVKPSPDHVS